MAPNMSAQRVHFKLLADMIYLEPMCAVMESRLYLSRHALINALLFLLARLFHGL
jgi:hypothetical protein